MLYTNLKLGTAQGAAPAIQAAMDLYHILSESDTHLRQPVGLKEQLMQNRRMSSEVGASMLQLLQVSFCSALSPWFDVLLWHEHGQLIGRSWQMPEASFLLCLMHV